MFATPEKQSGHTLLVAPAPDVFIGESDMAALMRTVDWAGTPIGAVESWPQSLRTVVSICLTSRFPIFLWWGPELVMLYNDAFRPILGASKHPTAMGQRGQECWPEIWPMIGPMLQGVVERGEATRSDDQLLLLDRNGYLEECYFTFTYSPIFGETGGVGGVFSAVIETTARVLGERRLETLRALAERTLEVSTVAGVCTIAAAVLADNPRDLPFALVYLRDADGAHARLAGCAGIEPDAPASPRVIELGAANADATWPLATVLRTGRPEHVTDLHTWSVPLPSGVWDTPPESALVLPIAKAGQEQPAGVLVVGISPRRALDDSYQGFLRLVAGSLASVIADARAYEEERQRGEALAELDRAKTAFFSDISHEFRTPLTLVLGALGEVLEQADTTLAGDTRAQLTMAQHNGLRLLKMVNTLLDFARIEAGRVTALYEPTDLGAYTAELASVFRSAIERAALRLIVDCPPLPRPVYVDREMWEKVVLNLLSNALKFTHVGEIALTLRWAGDQVELSVRDTGIGISERELPMLFDRFYRVHGAQARTHEGTGIGLALVKELVRLHGGAIDVRSRAGEGTTFTVRIPTGSAHLPADQIGVPRTHVATALGAGPYVNEALRWLPSGDQPAAGTLRAEPGADHIAAIGLGAAGARVLIADDNADMRDYLARLLGQHWSVEVVADGETALARAQADPPDLLLTDVMMRRAVGMKGRRHDDPPDLLLTDVMMPGLDGFALLRALRADPHLRAVPVVLLSARAGEEARVEGLNAGADDYLVKPFSARELIARVGAHLELARVRSEAAERERQARAEAEDARARLHDLFMQAPACIAVLHGPDHRFELANPDYFALVGSRALLGRTMREAVPEFADQGYFELLDEVYRSGVPFTGTEMRVMLDRGGDGVLEEGFYNFVYQPSLDPSGQVDGVLVFAFDITPQVRSRLEVERLAAERQQLLASEREARAEAEVANRAKDEFLSVLSHELRTPLTPILGFTQMLRRGSVTPAQSALALETIEHSARAQTRLVGDLLDVSRILADKLPLELALTELLPLVEAAVAAARPAANAKQIELTAALDPAIGPVLGDSDRLQQVIANLLGNAIKFTPDGGRVNVQLSRDRETARLIVSDTGVGIPPDFLPRIFERFSQADASTTRRHGGLGLGLAIAAHIVERHGGTLTAESGGVGLGAAFTVRLPLALTLPASVPHAPARAHGAGQQLTGSTVLIVEDDPDTRALLQLLIEDAGAVVICSDSSEAGLAVLDQTRVDVILADIGLPGENGYAFIAKVRDREDERGGKTPAVALTAYASAEDRRRALAAGFQRHLVKPVDRDVLLATLAALTERVGG